MQTSRLSACRASLVPPPLCLQGAGPSSRAISSRYRASSASIERASASTRSRSPGGITTAPEESANTYMARDHPDAPQDHGYVGLKRCHLAAAPSGRLARAVGGKVISRQLVEVAQAAVGEHACQTVALKARELGSTAHRDIDVTVGGEHQTPCPPGRCQPPRRRGWRGCSARDRARPSSSGSRRWSPRGRTGPAPASD